MRHLIFGGRSPIALAISKLLIENGSEVHLATRSIDTQLRDVANELKISHLHECDLHDSQSAVALATQVDGMTNGLNGIAFLHRYRSDKQDPIEQYAVEVYTPYQILESLANAHRSVELTAVLTSSPAATSVVSDQNFQYHASKAATEQLIRFASVRFAKNKLRTNGINPGAFVFKERATEYYENNPQILEIAENAVPLGRIATVDEIARVVVFLMSESSSFINGQILNIDGGRSNSAR